MTFLQLLFNGSMELWQVILLGILGVSFLAGLVFSIILFTGIMKKISELEEETKECMRLLSAYREAVEEIDNEFLGSVV
jgi:hypothetical protein